MSTSIQVSKEWLLEVRLGFKYMTQFGMTEKKILRWIFLETSEQNIFDLISIWQYNVDLIWREKLSISNTSRLQYYFILKAKREWNKKTIQRLLLFWSLADFSHRTVYLASGSKFWVCGVTIQMKPLQQYFHMMLFI